ncbi:alpha-ketoglutarate-dependent dioxygenase AlkB [Nocardioides sp. HDW12B]|uniref:alpha-ketoglutarate-dependent dioxygenase AlkB n=1 Tax=Nocardioides sp. HDW12B TaxID=2714939 RepID=UPI00140B3DB6|nr:alpha-ketoglutarate-dependent dioxygenase AlkB [Nocardioides sp. HDW12B]QIK65993.1 alpha-ketoglutarate-dependent dioxygenase AlkB [Nocardioides sp. HDW12B]
MTDAALPLFGAAETGAHVTVDSMFATAHRVHLDAHSWVEHVPGWLTGADRLFDELLQDAGWEQRRSWVYGERTVEPRLTAEHHDLTTAPETLQDAARALSAHYGVTYDRLWLNLYRDHHDSTGWHGDGASTRRRECVVPVLSLGAARRFLIRPTAGGRSSSFRPLAGDLVVMGGRCQTDWRHSVPKQTAPSGPRISVNFAATSQARPD